MITEKMQLFLFAFVVCCVALYALAFVLDILFSKRDAEYRKGFDDCLNGLPCKQGKPKRYEDGFGDCYAKMANDDARTDK